MLKSWLFVSGILLMGTAYTQNFSITNIPDSLRDKVNVVKRYEEKIYEIKSPGKVIAKERHVFTIMNSSGDDAAGYKTFYDQFISINSISGTLYDAVGKEMRHMKKKDMDDYSAFDGFSLAYDGRMKKFDFNCKDY